ncbi:MAG: copper chaperone PCu(A)C, partial [Ornithinimicrobium sp.]
PLGSLAPGLAIGALLVAGCGGSDSSSSGSAEDESAAPSAAIELELDDGWVKAADEGMTAAFGTLRNDSDEDIVLSSVTSEVADVGEFHVTEDDGSGSMAMKPAEDGFTVPAGGEHELEPGADHLMLMSLNQSVETGTTATVTVGADNGQVWSFEVPVREFAGADESYDSGESTSGMEMDSDDSDE